MTDSVYSPAVLRDALIRTAAVFRTGPPPAATAYPAAIDAEVLFWPVRALIAAMVAIIPLLLSFFLPRLDAHYTALTMSVLYWLILNRLYCWRRATALCRVCEALAQPAQAQTILDGNDTRPISAGAAARLVTLYSGKIILLYIFCAKYLVASMVVSSPLASWLRQSYLKLGIYDSQFMLVLLLLAMPVLVETGAALLYCTEGPGRTRKSPLLLLPAVIGCGLAGMLLITVLSPNALIVPFGLAIVLVFYWKKRADRDLRTMTPEIIDAYRDTAELAVLLGMVMIP